MFEAEILYKSEQYQAVLDLFAKDGSFCVDETLKLKYMADTYIKLDQNDKAKECYEKLIERNNGCYDFYLGYLRTCGHDQLNASTSDEANGLKIQELLQPFVDKYPRLISLHRLILTYSGNGELFQTLFKAQAKRFLNKGTPSLINDFKSYL